VRVGMEATGHSRWFERLLAELGIEDVDWRCGKDQEAAHPEAEDRPRRCPTLLSCYWKIGSSNLGTSPENRDLRQLLWHRHRLCRCGRES